MADMNILAKDAPTEQAHVVAPTTKTDDQNLPSSKWVPIRKSNCVLDVQKSQRNPIFSIDLDEKWFNLHKNVLRDALDITPTNDSNPYVALPLSDIVIEYVNTLGYLSTLKNVKLLYMTGQDTLCFRFFRVSFIAPTLTMLKGFGKNLFNPYKPFSVTRRILLLLHAERRRSLITYPKREPYYEEYQEHVAKYQQYLDAEHGKVEEGGATESLKATKGTKTKTAKATKPNGDKASTLTSTKLPKPKPAPT
nr:hypothetical protein [Tanacetum cinerariifolium]